MSGLSLIGGLAGGVGLFLLGMGLMTDGLKLAAGPTLERILANSTRTRVRGLVSGIMVTALVQSSSAVTVATIGFVNAGLLTFGQALWVLFGANVGTTMTGWLVALVGLKFKIEAFALPLVGIGMILRLTGEGSRRGALGMAMAGFGVLFLGIDLLKDTFSGLSADYRIPDGEGPGDVFVQVLIGIVLTVLMQSSSAALAVALTAAQGGMLATQGAAAVVIGANIGTTVTAVIAAIGATSDARRAAAAHILFNLLTGVVALLLLPWMIGALALLREALHLDSSPAAQLALFHTAFNVLGVILIWPVADRLARFLEARFRSALEDEARPRHLDRTVLAIPALALDALEREVCHLGEVALRTVRTAVEGSAAGANSLAGDGQIVERLNRAIAAFIVELNRGGMSGDSAQRLPELLRLARYYESAAELSAEAAAAALDDPTNAAVHVPARGCFVTASRSLLGLVAPGALATAIDREAASREAEQAYQQLKLQLLEYGANGRLPVVTMDAQLRSFSALRRALEQVTKAARLLGQH